MFHASSGLPRSARPGALCLPPPLWASASWAIITKPHGRSRVIPPTTPPPRSPPPLDQTALIARGKYLATAADCAPCHTGPGRAPIPWRAGDRHAVRRASHHPTSRRTRQPASATGRTSNSTMPVHDGIAPGHEFLVFPKYLYPAMPFTSYTKLSYADVMAIKAYISLTAAGAGRPRCQHAQLPLQPAPGAARLANAVLHSPGR